MRVNLKSPSLFIPPLLLLHTSPISSKVSEGRFAQVEDIVKSFAFESEMSGNIWSDCLRDRFDFQTSISAEQADTSLSDLLFARVETFCRDTKNLLAEKN